MNVIAQDGQWYLVDVGYGFGRVLDLEFDRFFPTGSLASLVAKGTWCPFEGDEAAVLARTHTAEDLETGSSRGHSTAEPHARARAASGG
jgi:hypothetical protein